MFRLKCALAVAAVLVTAAAVCADAPRLISYQGKVTDAGGTPAPGPVNLTVRLYDASAGGSVLFGPENHVGVALSSGVFTILIGSQTVGGVPNSALTALQVWLGVQVNAGAELTPRVRLAAAPYSLRVPNDLSLGIPSESGSLTVYRTVSNTKSIELLGQSSQISTYGSDGLEQVRLAGPTFGEMRLYDNAGNDTTVILSATGDSGGSMSLFAPDGTLRANLAGSSSGANFILRDSTAAATVSLRGDLGGSITVADSLNVESSIGGTLYAELTKHTGGAWLRTYDETGATTGYFGSAAVAGGFLQLYQGDGGMGINLDGDSSGAGALTIYQADGASGVFLDGDDAGAGAITIRDSSGSARVYLDGESTGTGGGISVYDATGTETVEILGAESSTEGGQIMLRNAAGTAAITLDGDASSAGAVTVHDSVGSTRVFLDGESTDTGGEVSVYDNDGTETVEILGAEAAAQGGQIVLRNAAGTSTITLDGDYTGDGRVTTQELQITGGSDLSEQFDVRGPVSPKPGMVVCIDPGNPGKLVVSRKAYDRSVAGVLSGAGGVKPGMMMGQAGSAADGGHPVALSGRVYCLCDASRGAIRPGDLLTTASVPGHAMKVADYDKAHGAIIGKAMTRLNKGRGLVLVLVALH